MANAIIVGTGSVANFCAVELQGRGVAVSFVETRQGVAAGSERFCARNHIPYQHLEKDALTALLKSRQEKTLIVSASNRYLFPAAVLENPYLTVVNYHGALLPKFPGRNAEAWAIFEQEKIGGITWHYVVKDVDAGKILVQKSVNITNQTTSFLLLREYAKLAQSAFTEIVYPLLSGTAEACPQSGQRGALRLSWMKPNDGVLSNDWDGEQVSAFLRAFDYGPLETLGHPQIDIKGVRYLIKSYRIASDAAQQEVCAFPIVAIDKPPYRFLLNVTPLNEEV